MIHDPTEGEGPGITVRVAAKINLHLGVGAARPDGFHPLDTVYMAVSLYDDISAFGKRYFRIDTTSSGHIDIDDVPEGEDNIVAHAARALARLHGRRRTGRIVVDKSIPVAGGMAGGSADAAGALVALDRLWGLHTSDEDLVRLAGELGSDVPFALFGGTAHGTGRGELVRPIAHEATYWWVIVPSRAGLSTPEVFRCFDRLHPHAPAEPTSGGALLEWLEGQPGSPEELGALLHNDLQAPALELRPELADLLVEGTSAGAIRGLVSGSGPTCLFLCGSGEEAQRVAGELGAFGRRTVLVATGPVAGAHLVKYD